MIFYEPFLTAGAVVGLSVFICFIRLLVGPTAANRAVALDTLNTAVIMLMLLAAAAYANVIFADVAIVYAIISYVGTLFIAKNIEVTAEKNRLGNELSVKNAEEGTS